jgi:hypothetical protein
LYDRAFRVVTGAGYNSMADMALYPDKHLAEAFERRYDDQQGRLSGPPAGEENGRDAAAAMIDAWLKELEGVNTGV